MQDPAEHELQNILLEMGGIRQRTDALMARGAFQRHHVLASRLLTLMGWGRLQANEVRWLAEGAELDGIESERVRELARCGTDGVHAGNVRRDILRKFNQQSGLPTPTTLTIEVHDKYSNIEDGRLHVTSAIHLADFVCRKYPDAFASIFGTAARCRAFWNKMRPDDQRFLAMNAITSQPG